MPWVPELFSAPALEQFEDKLRRSGPHTVPHFDGVMAGELDALVESFAGEPELHARARGRVTGVQAFSEFVTEQRAWLSERDVAVEDVERVAAGRGRFGEVVLRLGGEVDLPVAGVADTQSDGRIAELRCTSAPGRSPVATRFARRCCSPTRGCASQTSSALPACARGRRGRRALCRVRARSSTTSCGGAGRSFRHRPGSPRTHGARAASSPPRASTTTSIRRSPRVRVTAG